MKRLFVACLALAGWTFFLWGSWAAFQIAQMLGASRSGSLLVALVVFALGLILTVRLMSWQVVTFFQELAGIADHERGE